MKKKLLNIINSVKDQSKIKGLTHRFYKYPAGFSPVFAQAVINDLSKKNDLVLDPFMGGGTTIVEAIRANRKIVGIDLNPISYFVTNVKTTKLTEKNIKDIEEWALRMSSTIKFKVKNDRFLEKAFSLVNYKGLGKKEILNFKKIIKGSSFYLRKLKKIKNKKVNNFLRLLLLRTLQSSLHDIRPIADFNVFRNKIKSNSLDMLDGMKNFNEHLFNNKKKIKIYNKCSSTIHKISELKRNKAKLIVTSPPYPGINVPYARWQIHGRRNTTLPYLILGYKVPENKSIFNFQHPRNNKLDIYFATMKKIFSSIRKISTKKTILVQLVAFNSNLNFRRYLQTLKDCGFKEIKIKSKGHIWRKVPNRSWQARYVKGDIPASNEVLLMHRPV